MVRFIWVFVIGLVSVFAVKADDQMTFGKDEYLSGFISETKQIAQRDVFVSGFSVDVQGTVDGSLHAAAADVYVQAQVKGDVEAAGLSVRILSPVGRDVSAVAAAIKITEQASVGGNVRLASRGLVLDGPVAGSVLAAAEDIEIGGTIAGDTRLIAEKITFKDSARIGGVLTYSAPEPLDIPATVVSADRIRYEHLNVDSPQELMSRMKVWPTVWVFVVGGVVSICFLTLAAGLLLVLAPKTSAALQREAMSTPLQTMGIGIVGLAMLLGLVPVCILTLIGLPFLPFAVLAILVFWIGGYLLGVLGLTFRIFEAFRPIPVDLAARLLLIATGLAVIAMLNFVPFIGWLFNLAVMFLGLGAILSYTGRRVLQPRYPDADPAPVGPMPSNTVENEQRSQ